MSKHKKTREQKIISELRRKLKTRNITPDIKAEGKETEEKTTAYKLNFENKTIIKNQSNRIENNPFLKHDLLKTAYLTGSIVFAEIILLLVTKNM